MLTLHCELCLRKGQAASASAVRTLQGLLNKKPDKRLDWPHLLDHPFVKESDEERLAREARICTAAACAEASRAWKGEGGAIAGAAVYSGARSRVLDVTRPCLQHFCCTVHAEVQVRSAVAARHLWH